VQTPFIRKIKENRSAPRVVGDRVGALLLRDETDDGDSDGKVDGIIDSDGKVDSVGLTDEMTDCALRFRNTGAEEIADRRELGMVVGCSDGTEDRLETGKGDKVPDGTEDVCGDGSSGACTSSTLITERKDSSHS
jgi:hypothetical protein